MPDRSRELRQGKAGRRRAATKRPGRRTAAPRSPTDEGTRNVPTARRPGRASLFSDRRARGAVRGRRGPPRHPRPAPARRARSADAGRPTAPRQRRERVAAPQPAGPAEPDRALRGELARMRGHDEQLARDALRLQRGRRTSRRAWKTACASSSRCRCTVDGREFRPTRQRAARLRGRAGRLPQGRLRRRRRPPSRVLRKRYPPAATGPRPCSGWATRSTPTATTAAPSPTSARCCSRRPTMRARPRPCCRSPTARSS
jgi:hypothetical protein